MEFETGTNGSARRKPRSLRSFLLLSGTAFLAGIAMMGWGLSRWEEARHWLYERSSAEKAPAVAGPSADGHDVLPAPTLSSPDISARIADIEARMARVEAAQSSVSGGNPARAEALLVCFAARRAIDRGIGLGYVEGLLTQRFGTSQPRAVAAVIAAARQPVTLEQLKSGLAAIAPLLAGRGQDEGWWSSFKHGLSDVFVVRQAGTQPTDTQSRIARASRAIDAGQVDLALLEIARLPTRNKAADWLGKARRYVEAHRALDLLEAAAITAAEPISPSAAAEPAQPAPKSGPMF